MLGRVLDDIRDMSSWSMTLFFITMLEVMVGEMDARQHMKSRRMGERFFDYGDWGCGLANGRETAYGVSAHGEKFFHYLVYGGGAGNECNDQGHRVNSASRLSVVDDCFYCLAGLLMAHVSWLIAEYDRWEGCNQATSLACMACLVR